MLRGLRGSRFLVLGRAGMDLYADPPGSQTEEAAAFTSALGGSAANIAAGIVRLGGAASLVTTLSDDAVGHYVRRQLAQYGVDTAHTEWTRSQSRTSLAVVETRLENCQSVIYRNNASDFMLNSAQIARIDMKAFDALVVTGTALAMEPSRAATMEAIRQASAADVPVILDVDYRPYSWLSAEDAARTCRAAAEASDVIIGNDTEWDVMAGGSGGLPLAQSLATGSVIAIYKMGEKGSISFAGGDRFEMPIYRVAALKPTGAGDAFMAGLVTGLARGLDLPAAVRRGTAAAAIVVTRVGCAPASPTEQELDAFMRDNPAPA